MVYKTSNMGRVAMMQSLRCKSLSFAWQKKRDEAEAQPRTTNE